MNRRTALKNLTMGLGYTVAAPTIFNMLASCNAESKTWNPLFLSPDEKHMVIHLSDIILPKTDTPGAIDINVPQFLDMMYFEIETPKNQEIFRKGATLFTEKLASTNNKPVLEIEKEDIETLLSSYFSISDEETEILLEEQKLDLDLDTPENLDQYYLYKFLLSVKYYILFGFFTSEKVGEEILDYDPIPGTYLGCITVEEATKGKAWSL